MKKEEVINVIKWFRNFVPMMSPKRSDELADEYLESTPPVNGCRCGKIIDERYDPCCSHECWSEQFEPQPPPVEYKLPPINSIYHNIALDVIEKIKGPLSENPDLSNPKERAYAHGYKSATINILKIIEESSPPVYELADEIKEWTQSTPPVEVCEWIPDEDYGSWDTGCGNSFMFNDGTLEENKARYCQYCGKPIKERKE